MKKNTKIKPIGTLIARLARIIGRTWWELHRFIARLARIIGRTWTPLTDRELEYCYNDVIGLVEAYKAGSQP